MMNFHELTKKYVDLDKKYRQYVSQFVSVGWEGEKLTMPKKSFNREEYVKIKKLKEEVDKAHNEWLEALNAGIE